jgi:hypothetical protein
MRNVYRIYLENMKGRDYFGDLDLKEIEYVSVNFIHVVQYRDQWQAVWHGSDPSHSIQGREVLE